MIIDLLTKEEKRLTKTINYKANEILFYENDICNEIGIVIEGEIRIASITFKGNEVIYNLLTKGEVFGNNLLFSNDNRFRGDVKAIKNSKICLISKNNLLKILMDNKEFLQEYLHIHSEFTKSLNTKIKLLTFDNAKERLLYLFYINNNRIIYKNVTSLAHQLYLSREVTSRLLSELVRKGTINRKKHEIRLLEI